MRAARWFLLLSSGLLAACSEPDGPALSQRSDGIVGGTPAPLESSVFFLEARRPDGGLGRCSATLLAPSTLLTAAHCVTDPSAAYRASNSLEPWVSSGPWTDLSALRLHPAYEPTSGANDLALLLLAAPSTAAPIPWNETTDLTASMGESVRAVGYGWTSWSSATPPVRRAVPLVIDGVSELEVKLGDSFDRGICYGDSGGAALLTFPDGVQRLAALLSRTLDTRCTEGAAVRVDRYRDFISRWLSEREGIPACLDDGRCRPGCAPVDVDCACVPDGVCRADCEAPERDEDCARGCGADGVCVTAGCGRPDVDCQPDGIRCESALHCEGGRCTTDPQHPEPYCTRPCDSAGGCPSGKRCGADRVCRHLLLPEAAVGQPCTPGLTLCQSAECVQTRGDFLCRAPCDARARCEEAADECVTRSGRMVCEPILPVVAVAAPSGACSAAPGPAMAAIGLWLALRGRCSRRRRLTSTPQIGPAV